jgi:hypothetical protein
MYERPYEICTVTSIGTTNIVKRGSIYCSKDCTLEYVCIMMALSLCHKHVTNLSHQLGHMCLIIITKLEGSVSNTDMQCDFLVLCYIIRNFHILTGN